MFSFNLVYPFSVQRYLWIKDILTFSNHLPLLCSIPLDLLMQNSTTGYNALYVSVFSEWHATLIDTHLQCHRLWLSLPCTDGPDQFRIPWHFGKWQTFNLLDTLLKSLLGQKAINHRWKGTSKSLKNMILTGFALAQSVIEWRAGS